MNPPISEETDAQNRPDRTYPSRSLILMNFLKGASTTCRNFQFNQTALFKSVVNLRKMISFY